MKRFIFILITVLAFVSCKQDDDVKLPQPETGSVTDCQGNVYPTVKIGNQWWMTENLRATKYDTESERKPALPATEIIIPISPRSSNVNYGPFYVDSSDFETDYSANISAEQRSKLGFLYTWAAAVGESSASNAQNRTTNYTTSRQGICPNGWHIPTDAEWTVLIDYLGGKEKAGKLMKTSSGWFQNKDYAAGTNGSGFSALPSGYDTGTSIGVDKIPTTYGIGFDANFWSANANPWHRGLSCNSSAVNRLVYAKFHFLSVRCVKNQ